MAVLRVLSSEGDTPTTFSSEVHDEAEALFKRLQTHYTGFRINSEGPATRLDKFDSQADEIVMVPKVVGG